ncbi:MAG: hypothetical protein K0R00_200 [Herbinix sp.]|jgi:hypothetical protein|nr:hypothetical protein [Herbinix sp.]
MPKGLEYWKQELIGAAKKLVIDTVIYTVKNIIASFVEEHLIKRPMKKIFTINKRWGWDDDFAL